MKTGYDLRSIINPIAEFSKENPGERFDSFSVGKTTFHYTIIDGDVVCDYIRIGDNIFPKMIPTLIHGEMPKISPEIWKAESQARWTRAEIFRKWLDVMLHIDTQSGLGTPFNAKLLMRLNGAYITMDGENILHTGASIYFVTRLDKKLQNIPPVASPLLTVECGGVEFFDKPMNIREKTEIAPAAAAISPTIYRLGDGRFLVVSDHFMIFD